MSEEITPVQNDTEPVEPTPEVEKPAENTEPTGTLAGSAGEQKEETPTAPEAYDFTQSLPEGMELDQQAANEFSDIARGMNLTNDQANQLAKYGMSYAQNMAKAIAQQQIEEQQAWADETKKALGAKYNEEISYVGTALNKLEPLVPGLRQALNIGGIGNRIEIVKALAQVGRMVSEDSGHAATDTSAGEAHSTRYPNTNFNSYK
jgi:hypothetical protein|nr:MAG TPA: putative protease [Caudoviricetes sp.]